MRKLSYLLFLVVFISCNEIQVERKLNTVSQKFSEGKFEEVKNDLNALLESSVKNKRNVLIWTILGHTHESLDEDSLAMVAYKNALLIDEEKVEAITGLGILARKRYDYDSAVRHYKKAISLNPEYAQAISSLSVIYLKRKEFEKSVEVGEQAWELDNEDPAISANLAIACFYLGDTIKMNKYLDISESLNYRNMQALEDIISGELTVLD